MQVQLKGEAVAVINTQRHWLKLFTLVVLFCQSVVSVSAATLPEDRADAMFHSYDGGGVTVDGPAILVRKSVKQNLSLSASYYQDTISGASPDVIATASKYSDKRDEYSLNADYLYNDATINVGFTKSEEDDYTADTYQLGLAQEVFGGMTTVTISFARGDDEVGNIDNPAFSESVDRLSYQLGISQILSDSLIINANLETIADEGFLNNPYRKVRILGVFAGDEVYPETRTSHALSLSGKYYWPSESRIAASLGYRYFTDTWDIQAHTLNMGLSYALNELSILDVYYRYYTQGNASFYQDDFDSSQNYMARDKELSQFSNHVIGVQASYQVFDSRYGLDRGSLNVGLESISYSYDNYTDVTSASGGNYSFDAISARVFFSVWY